MRRIYWSYSRTVGA